MDVVSTLMISDPVGSAAEPYQTELILRRWGTHALHVAAAIVFFFVPWWLRIDLGRDGDPYFVRFLITLPWLTTIILWMVLGFGGFGAWVRARLWIAPWVFLVIWAYLSQGWSPFSQPAWDATIQLFAVSFFALAMATAAPPPKYAAAALGAGLIFQGVIAIAQATLQQPVGLQLLGEFEIRPSGVGLNVLKVNGISWLRPYGLTAHPNMLGGFFAAALIVVLALLLTQSLKRRWQIVIGITAGVGYWALLLTFSRAAWVGLAVGILALIIACWRFHVAIHWRRLWLALGIGLALTAVFVGTHRDLVFARTGIGDESNELRSISDRVLFTEYALDMIRNRPLTGQGIGMNPWVAAQMILHDPRQIDMQAQSVHNIPLLLWSELGLIGLAAWLASLAGAALVLVRSKARDPLIWGAAAGVLALLVISLLDFYMWSIFPFALLWWGLLGVTIHEATQPT